jgi:hypothetical protein
MFDPLALNLISCCECRKTHDLNSVNHHAWFEDIRLRYYLGRQQVSNELSSLNGQRKTSLFFTLIVTGVVLLISGILLIDQGAKEFAVMKQCTQFVSCVSIAVEVSSLEFVAGSFLTILGTALSITGAMCRLRPLTNCFLMASGLIGIITSYISIVVGVAFLYVASRIPSHIGFGDPLPMLIQDGTSGFVGFIFGAFGGIMAIKRIHPELIPLGFGMLILTSSSLMVIPSLDLIPLADLGLSNILLSILGIALACVGMRESIVGRLESWTQNRHSVRDS